jgi:hypothetical protein
MYFYPRHCTDASVQFHTLAALSPVPDPAFKLPEIEHRSLGRTSRDLV